MYLKDYKNSIEKNEEFWINIGNELSWFKPYTKLKHITKDSVSWYINGKLNISYNCIDRHLPQKANDIALIFEHEEQKTQQYTFYQVKQEVSKVANAMKSIGIKKHDIVTTFLANSPEAIFTFLACARIGAVHNVVFSGLSGESLYKRMKYNNSSYLITTDQVRRGGENINLIPAIEVLLSKHKNCELLLYTKNFNKLANSSAYINWNYTINQQSDECDCEVMDANDPLFVLYTSGSTGEPKGIVHSSAGYAAYSQFTFKNSFNYQEGDVYWGCADIGWITGHSYIVYGPLLNGAKSVIFTGKINYPDSYNIWNICQKYSVNILYTAPTTIRMLMKDTDNAKINNYDLSSLKVLGTVGEPIDNNAWHWYNDVIGNNKCNIVDTWWQTETGGHMITTIPNLSKSKPARPGFPYLGVQVEILDNNGNIITQSNNEGYLCIKHGSWPGQLLDILGNKQRYIDSYLSQFPGYFMSGDLALYDEDKYIRITGRADDVINISGHRLSTAEIENHTNDIQGILETAIIEEHHEITGNQIVAFCVLESGVDDISISVINSHIDETVGKIARIQKIFVVRGLPKTASGKIVRRVLKKIVNNETSSMGDISTITDHNVINDIIDVVIKSKQ